MLGKQQIYFPGVKPENSMQNYGESRERKMMNAAEVLPRIDSNNCVFIHLSPIFTKHIYYEP